MCHDRSRTQARAQRLDTQPRLQVHVHVQRDRRRDARLHPLRRARPAPGLQAAAPARRARGGARRGRRACGSRGQGRAPCAPPWRPGRGRGRPPLRAAAGGCPATCPASPVHRRALAAIPRTTAAKASANFPPVFAPLHLRGLFDGEKIDRLRLSDGGLDDNNGIESVMDERCTHVIASEAGPGPQVTRDIGWNRLGMMIQIVFNQLMIVRRLELSALREQARVHRALVELAASASPAPATPGIAELRRRYPVEAVAFFLTDSSLGDGVPESDSPPPLPAHPLAREVSGLRIDLDGFSDIEQDALVYQGYQYADRFVRRYVYPSLAASGLAPAVPPPPESPVTLPATAAEWDHAQRVLVAGAAMFGRAWKIGGGGRGADAGAVAALLAVEACAGGGRGGRPARGR